LIDGKDNVQRDVFSFYLEKWSRRETVERWEQGTENGCALCPLLEMTCDVLPDNPGGRRKKQQVFPVNTVGLVAISFLFECVFPPLLPAQSILVPLLEVRGKRSSIPVHWGEVLGQAMVGLDDDNGDGRVDIIPSWRRTDSRTDTSFDTVFYGHPKFHPVDVRATPATAFDINEDGFDDIMAWTPNGDFPKTKRGRVCYFFGSPFSAPLPV